MRINADLSQRAVVASDALPWVASPLPGVERRMLEREGAEVARVTSLVRYAPNSRFSAHTHSGGEEFLVLEGTFSDDYGDFPAGTYVRNPVGSKHTPHTDGGCLILVKLWWMHPDDQAFVRIDTAREDLWRPSETRGIEVMPLHRFGDESALSPRGRCRAAAARPARGRGDLRPGRRLPRRRGELCQGRLGALADRRGAGAGQRRGLPAVRQARPPAASAARAGHALSADRHAPAPWRIYLRAAAASERRPARYQPSARSCAARSTPKPTW